MTAGVKTLGLFHHNQERTDVGVDDILSRSIDMVRERQGSLTCCAVYRDMQFII